MNERPAHNPFPARLRALRKEAGLTQEELAERAGVTHGTISRIERGKIALTEDMRFKLAAALDLSPASLVIEDEHARLAQVWDRIDPTARPLALRVLESFVADFRPDHPGGAALKPRRSRKR